MRGFDAKFEDFPDFILKITKEIWEDRHVSSLHRYYTSDILVRSPNGIVVGNQNVIADTLSTLSEFPDRELLGEDVIWCGTPETGMLSSHRLFSTATHRGGAFGEASAKRVAFRTIADCHAINNQINDEWLIRDQGAIARQLGLLPEAFAARRISEEGGVNACTPPFTPDMDRAGPYQGTGDPGEFGGRYADILVRIMAADLAVIPAAYDRACSLEHPGGARGRGWADADRFWTTLRSSFPSANFSVDHVIGRNDPAMPPRAAVRWSLRGAHDGWGAFGRPTGADVYVMGAAHAEFGPWGLRREYVLFDEIAIWKQILIAKG